eukprot:scaffold74360_cov68-Cyclotella_meneghiniana.AAC.7
MGGVGREHLKVTGHSRQQRQQSRAGAGGQGQVGAVAPHTSAGKIGQDHHHQSSWQDTLTTFWIFLG